MTFLGAITPCREGRSRHWPSATDGDRVVRRAGGTSRSAATPQIGGVCAGAWFLSQRECAATVRRRHPARLRDLRGPPNVARRVHFGLGLDSDRQLDSVAATPLAPTSLTHPPICSIPSMRLPAIRSLRPGTPAKGRSRVATLHLPAPMSAPGRFTTDASGHPEGAGQPWTRIREALTRGPNPGRRDRAEPLARPTREDVSPEGRVVRGLASESPERFV